jgi:hypothetical protein
LPPDMKIDIEQSKKRKEELEEENKREFERMQ